MPLQLPVTDRRVVLCLEFLEISQKDWDGLVRAKVAPHLMVIIPMLVSYQDDLEEVRDFFTEVKELTLTNGIEEQLSLLDKVRVGLTNLVEDPNFDLLSSGPDLERTELLIQVAYTAFSKTESFTVDLFKEKSQLGPKISSFIESVRPYWNHIDSFWSSIREVILSAWGSYFDAINGLLTELSEIFSADKSVHASLIRIEELLKKRGAGTLAQRVADSNSKIKDFQIEEHGLIPAYMGAQGNWKVEKDDCPDKELPDRSTKLTSRFAFCRLGDKKCPAFRWSQGSYVKCAAWVRVKEARFLSPPEKLGDEELLSDLKDIAQSDPYVKMLWHSADQHSGDLFVSTVVGNKIHKMLATYPKSSSIGEFSYTVYLVAEEPVLVSGDKAIAADKVLLGIIGEGERMPKHAETVKLAEQVMRITFTGNALRDPEFRDWLRKKHATKAKHMTWDIPFDREDDISFTLREIRDEFGYKVEVFHIMDDTDSLIEHDFGLYQLSDYPLSRYSAFRVAMTYVPPAESMEISLPSMSLEASARLKDVWAKLPGGPLRVRVASLSDRLRVAAHIFVASKKEVIHYANGAIGVIPEVGQRWVESDPDTQQPTVVELVEVIKGGSDKLAYKARSLDTGKEIILRRSWLRSACPNGGAPMPPPPDAPAAHIIGEDDLYYIVQLPKVMVPPDRVPVDPQDMMDSFPAPPVDVGFGGTPPETTPVLLDGYQDGPTTIRVPPSVAPEPVSPVGGGALPPFLLRGLLP